jgi:hypothetical protein
MNEALNMANNLLNIISKAQTGEIMNKYEKYAKNNIGELVSLKYEDEPEVYTGVISGYNKYDLIIGLDNLQFTEGWSNPGSWDHISIKKPFYIFAQIENILT